jgi:hypothetical protein
MSEFCRIVEQGPEIEPGPCNQEPGGSVSIGGSAFRLFLRFLSGISRFARGKRILQVCWPSQKGAIQQHL